MFVLWIIVTTLVAVGGPETVVRGQSYPTLAACEAVKARVLADMAAAYPGETDYRLECKLEGV